MSSTENIRVDRIRGAWHWTDWNGRARSIAVQRNVNPPNSPFTQQDDTKISADVLQVILLDEICGRLEEVSEKLDALRASLDR